MIRITLFDDILQTRSVRLLGFQAECDCGWAGERRQVMATARRDMRAHLEWWHRKRGKDE